MELPINEIKEKLTKGLTDKLVKYDIPIDYVFVDIRETKYHPDPNVAYMYSENTLLVHTRINDLALNRFMVNHNFNEWCEDEINNIFYLFYGEDLMEKKLLKVEDYTPLPKCCKPTLWQRFKNLFKRRK